MKSGAEKVELLAGMELALAVEPERLVEAGQHVAMALAQRIVRGGEAHHPAHAARLRLPHAQQPDELRHQEVVGVVVVELQVDVGLVRPYAAARQRLLAGVVHVVDDRAVELLRHRPLEHRRQDPVERLGLVERQLLDRQALQQREADAVGQDGTHFFHRGAAGGQLEAVGAQREQRHRLAAQALHGVHQFGLRRGREDDAIVGIADVVARPGLAAGDGAVDDGGVFHAGNNAAKSAAMPRCRRAGLTDSGGAPMLAAMRLSRRRAAAALLSVIVAPTVAVRQWRGRRPIPPVRSASSCRTGPGGITDIVARIAARRLSERLGQPVVIDNKAGASGIIGTEFVARCRPDGYTLLMVYPSHPVNPALKQQLPYDTIRDFVGFTSSPPCRWCCSCRRRWRRARVQELIALSKRERLPTPRSAAAAWRIWGPSFRQGRHRDEAVPYERVGGQQALMSGEVSMFSDTPITARSAVQGQGCARSASHASARRCCPTCRPSMRRRCRATRCWAGTASWRPPRRRSRSCRS